MKREALFLAGFAFLFGCQDSSGPDATYLHTEPLTHEGYCADLVDDNPGTWNVKIDLGIEIPGRTGEGKSLDYLLLRVYGFEPQIMDVPACEYYSRKIKLDAEQYDASIGDTLSIQILARLSGENVNYFSIEGYQIMPNDAVVRVLSRNAPPMDVSLSPKHYEIDSLVWVD